MPLMPAASADPAAPHPAAPDPRRWRALAVCLVAGFMTLLDVSIVNVAVPSMRAGLDASASDLSWVLSGYALAFGLVLVPAGRLGDARGRRTVFVAGLALFLLASAACGLAPTATTLALARLVQGFAGGLINPQVAGLIQALFRGAERGRAFGFLGASIGFSTAVGPVLGGLIISGVGGEDAWRWVFFVNLPVGLVALPLAWRLIPADLGSGRRESVDPVGVVLLALGLFLLFLPLVEVRRAGPAAGVLVPLAGVVLAGFVVWERRHRGRGREPVVDLTLFRRRSYTLGVGIGVLYFAGFTSIFLVLTLYLQSGLGLSALQAGLVTTPFALGGALAAGFGGGSVTRVGRPLVAVGLVLSAVGLVAADVVADLVDGRVVALALLVPLAVAGIGSGLTISPNQTLTLAEAPVAGAGSAAGVLQTAQRVGTALGIAVVAAVFFAVLGDTDADPDWAGALRAGLRVSTAFVLAALLLAALDLRAGRVRRARDVLVPR